MIAVNPHLFENVSAEDLAISQKEQKAKRTGQKSIIWNQTVNNIDDFSSKQVF